jgi:hypothetical protein
MGPSYGLESGIPLHKAIERNTIECIHFELTPLGNERTEIITTYADAPSIQGYCAELLAETEKRWKAEGDEATPTEPATTQAQSPAPTDAPKTTKQRSAQLIAIVPFLLGVLIALVTNVASSTLPKEWEPYLWLSWPLLGVLVMLSIFLVLRQNGTSETHGA